MAPTYFVVRSNFDLQVQINYGFLHLARGGLLAPLLGVLGHFAALLVRAGGLVASLVGLLLSGPVVEGVAPGVLLLTHSALVN